MSFDTTSLCGVTDYSTHQNHGVINGSPTYDSGFKGQAMSFDDSVGSIEIENANLMSQSFTLLLGFMLKIRHFQSLFFHKVLLPPHS